MHGQRVSGDEMIKSRGMKDIQTLCGRAHRDRAVTGTRVQAVNELAYLEHAKDQLERELVVWTGNQKRAGSRLQSVNQRIALLQGILEMEPSAKSRAPSPDQEAKGDGPEAGLHRREVTLEY